MGSLDGGLTDLIVVVLLSGDAAGADDGDLDLDKLLVVVDIVPCAEPSSPGFFGGGFDLRWSEAGGGFESRWCDAVVLSTSNLSIL